jgi:GT2 family glycosyltransferase
MSENIDLVVVHHSGDVDRFLSSIGKVPGKIISINTSYEGESHKRDIIYSPGLSWVRAANIGLCLSTAPYVVLCNDDVEIQTEGWLEKLKSVFYFPLQVPYPPTWVLDKYSKRGIVAPLSAYRQRGKEESISGSPFPVKPLVCLKDKWLGWYPLSFWCVMFKQEALKDVGLLDLRFADGYGADDDDWQLRAHRKGWEILVHPEVHAKHEGSASWGQGEVKSKAQAKNLKLFQEKWRGENV